MFQEALALVFEDAAHLAPYALLPVPDNPSALDQRVDGALRWCDGSDGSRALAAAFEHRRCWYEECLRLICTGAGADALLDKATADLANPVAYFDRTGTLIHQTGSFSAEYAGTIWENVMSLGYTNPGFFDEREQAQISSRFSRHEEVILGSFVNDPAHRYAIVPLFEGDSFAGSLAAIDINAPLTPGQVELMRLCGQLVGLCGRRATGGGGRSHDVAYYAERLLKGDEVKRGSVERHLARSGWERGEEFCVLRLLIPEFSPESDLISMYEPRTRQILPRAIWVLHEGALVALARTRDFDPLNEGHRSRLEGILSKTHMRCAVSSRSTDFMDLRTLHGQCRLTLQVVQGRQDVHLSFFDEQYPEVLRQELGRMGSMRILCHPLVLRLAESERQQDHVRLDSLRAFLVNGRSVGDAARSLGVHRNTMLYRLDRLQQMLGEDLYAVGEEKLAYLLVSCLMVE